MNLGSGCEANILECLATGLHSSPCGMRSRASGPTAAGRIKDWLELLVNIDSEPVFARKNRCSSDPHRIRHRKMECLFEICDCLNSVVRSLEAQSAPYQGGKFTRGMSVRGELAQLINDLAVEFHILPRKKNLNASE
jgi:hypothetical protein